MDLVVTWQVSGAGYKSVLLFLPFPFFHQAGLGRSARSISQLPPGGRVHDRSMYPDEMEGGIGRLEPWPLELEASVPSDGGIRVRAKS